MTAAFTAGYEAGKKEGYEEGYSAGWEAGRETAAEWHDARVEIIKNFDNPHNRVLKRIHVESAAAIRKLKKP